MIAADNGIHFGSLFFMQPRCTHSTSVLASPGTMSKFLKKIYFSAGENTHALTKLEVELEVVIRGVPVVYFSRYIAVHTPLSANADITTSIATVQASTSDATTDL